MSNRKWLHLIWMALLGGVLLFFVTTRGAAAPAAQTGWTLVWEDNFDGTGAPSSTNWNYHVGNGFNPGLAGFDGWGNGEWEWYRPQNCSLSGGNLVIKAEYNTAPTNIAGRDWYQFSCRITSDTKRSITYGAIESRMQLPMNYGTWPAFWMMGDSCDDTSTSSYNPAAGYYDRMASNWSSCGEIDIMEHRNADAAVVHNLFWDSRIGVFPWDCCTNQNNPSELPLSNPGGFHTYRFEWTSTQLRWLVDGNVTKTQDISAANMEEFRSGFHLILNLAISGAFTGNAHPNQAEFPLFMNVDYVRVYQAGGTPPPTTPPPTTPPPTTPPPGLPSPWVTGDIGAVAAAGSASYANNVFTVRGSGADIWNAADEFRFVYRSLTGDGSITARVASQTNTNAWAKAGVMIRDTTGAGSTHASMVVTPTSGTSFQRRTATNGTSTSTAGPAGAAPRWVRMTRAGSNFTAATSTDGVNWTTVGSATITMGGTVQVGLAVTSHADGTISTATFDNVNVTGGTPPPTTPPPTTPPPTTPAADYTQGVTSLNGTQARIWFRPTTASSLVDVHYLISGQGQQNFRMTNNAGTWEQVVSNLSAGTVIEYWFTYEKGGPLFVTQHFFYTQGGSPTTPPPTTPPPTTPPPTTPPPTTPPPSGNLALNRPATGSASCNTSETPPKAVNGSVSGGNSDKFCSGATTKFLQVDLGSSRSVNQFVVKHAGAGGESTTYNTRGFNIQTSTDNVNWSTAVTVTTNTANISTHNITARNARYVRLNITQAVQATGGVARIYEFEVYGATVTPTPTTPAPTTCTNTGPAGSYPLCIQNNTAGRWTNSQIYLTILGQATPGEWHYVRADGTTAHINAADASAPNRLTKNGINYPNMSFTMTQANGKVPMPTRWEGGRIYFSLGSPMYIPVSPDNRGWGGPDPLNPTDPNNDVYYDWYEFTYIHNLIPFGGNTTQVDIFGFPMTARLQQSAIGYDQTIGITQTRAQVMSQYTSVVGPAFDPLASEFRILAPRSSAAFMPGGSQANYMSAHIDQVWNHYTANQFNLTRGGVTFTGQVVGGRLQFTRNGVGPYFIDKPTSHDVFACAGALARGTDQEKELQAELCAAFHRGVALNTSQWYTPSAYYTGSIKNDYSMFFHQISLQGRAYGFPYDDVNDQSTVKILPNANPPSALTISIGW